LHTCFHPPLDSVILCLLSLQEDVSAEKVEWTDEIGLEEGLSQSDDEEDEGNSSIVLGQVPKDEQIALSPRLKGFSSRQKGFHSRLSASLWIKKPSFAGKKTKRSRGKRTPVSGPRERVRWSDAEEKCLLAHVAKIPHGTKKKWETILKRGKGVFQDFRTAVRLFKLLSFAFIPPNHDPPTHPLATFSVSRLAVLTLTLQNRATSRTSGGT